MRRRLYFVLPDITSAYKTANDLLLARIENKYMRFLAKRGTDLGILHEAGPLQKSDCVHGAQTGMVTGAVCMLLMSVAVFMLQLDGFHVRHIFILGMTLFGALFGIWTGSMVGTSLPNSRLKQFHQDMEEGRILLMVDVPILRMGEIRELIGLQHPEANARGFEPTIPAFP